MGSLVLIAHFNLYLSSLHSYEKLVDTWARYPRMTMPEGQSCTRKYLKRRRRAKDSKELLAEKFDRFRTLRNNTQQHPTTWNRVCKRTQLVTSYNVGSCRSTMFASVCMGLNNMLQNVQTEAICNIHLDIFKWPTMLLPFAWGFKIH